MRLDQELVRRKLCESRTEAQELIKKGVVFVEDIISTKQIQQVTELTTIEVKGKRQFVSRGGEKLQGVLRNIFKNDEEIQIFCSGKVVLDIGSSTGGFTDCLLSYGVAHVDAVDVGTSQLHVSLRDNQKVSVYENTDIRNFRGRGYDVIVADLSFISLSVIFDTIISFGKCGTLYCLLIKPQFEVGKGNTKKGIVKDVELVASIVKHYEERAKKEGLEKVKVTPCVIAGGDGNQEYFLCGVQK